MCGIAGIAGIGFDKSHLPEILSKIKHRGPDGNGFWDADRFCLGHVRLSIIDLSNQASQPMICQSSGNVLAYNGEIYNYLELKKELQDGYPFRTESDSEVMLAAYLKWGEGFLSRLRGMFAFALYDRGLNRLMIARDRFGIKPFYYRYGRGHFIFASEIKGLLGLRGLPHTANEDKILDFFSHRHQDTDENTFFREIKQLTPASYAWVDREGRMTPIKSFWSLPLAGNKKFLKTDEEQLKAKLFETVSLHMRADVPVGAFMSGGLDSSTVVCIASRQLEAGHKLNTFSSILENTNEENQLIPILQRRTAGVPHELHLRGEGFLDTLKKIIYHHDEPIPDASMYVHYELCRLAKSNGMKVLLSGSGGDEALGGYQNHTYAFLGRLLRRGSVSALHRYISTYQTSRYESKSNLWLRAAQEASPFFIRESIKRNKAWRNRSFFNFEVKVENLRYYKHRDSDPWLANFKNCYSSWTIPPFLHYEDRNSMAFGLEIRVPFVDHELIEFIAQYSPSEIVGGISKNILRRSMKGIVPHEILQEKSKHGLPAPIGSYSRYDARKTFDYFCVHVKEVPFINYKKAEETAREFLHENRDDRVNDFWRLLSLAAWHRVFFASKAV